MKLAVALAATALLAAGAASASEQMSDADYIKAHRCKGLAVGLKDVVDPAPLEALIKSADRGRSALAVERADAEFNRARRDAKRAGAQQRLAAELTSACQAYLGDGASVARGQGSTRSR